MIGYYAIINCPKCGIRIPVLYGYEGGFDSTINMKPKVTCYNEKCLNEFEVDFNIEKHKICKVDYDELQYTSMKQYYENLLMILKNK